MDGQRELRYIVSFHRPLQQIQVRNCIDEREKSKLVILVRVNESDEKINISRGLSMPNLTEPMYDNNEQLVSSENIDSDISQAHNMPILIEPVNSSKNEQKANTMNSVDDVYNNV